MASNILRNALAYKDSHRQDALMRNRIAALRAEQAEQERRSALAQNIGNALVTNDLGGAAKLAYQGGEIGMGNTLADRQAAQGKAAQDAQTAAGEELATVMGGILQLPEDQQGDAYLAVLPQIHSALDRAKIEYDPNDRTFDDNDRAVARGLAARFGKLPGASDGNFGVGGVWGKDKDGKPVFMQVSSKGGLVRPPVPEGVTLTEQPKVIGGSIFGNRTGERKTDVTSDLRAGEAAKEEGKIEGRGEIPQREQKEAGKTRLSTALQALTETYLRLNELGAVVNPDRGSLENMSARLASSGAGQMLGGALGTEAQSLRERINSIRPLIVQHIRAASGMSARGMDSNRELQFYLQAASDPTKDIFSNLVAIQVLDDTFGLGDVLEKTVPPEMLKRIQDQAKVERKENPISITRERRGDTQSAPSQPPEQAQPQVPDAAIQFLMQNPQLADQFDAKYGQGAAQRYLGGQ